MPSIQQKRDIPIDQLHFWLQNPRLNSYAGSKDESEVIAFYTQAKGLTPFLEPMVEHFNLIPQESLVVYGDRDRYTVYDGNRRLACYKLLSRAVISPDDAIQKIVQKFSQGESIDKEYKVNCIVCTSEEEAKVYADIQHIKDAKMSWEIDETLDFAIKNDTQAFPNIGKEDQERLLAIIRYMKRSAIPLIYQHLILKKNFHLFQQIMLSWYVWGVFKLSLDKQACLKYSDSFSKKFPALIYAITRLRNGVRDVHEAFVVNLLERIKNGDGEKYLQKMRDQSFQNPEVRDLFAEHSGGGQGGKGNANMGKSTNERKTLFSRKRFNKKRLDGRFGDIYREIAKISVDEAPNAIALLFRTFLAFAIQRYAQKRGKNFSQEDRMKSCLSWLVKNLKESGEEVSVCLSAERLGNKDYRKFLTIDDFNGLVHNVNLFPDPSTMKNTWNELEGLFHVLIPDE